MKPKSYNTIDILALLSFSLIAASCKKEHLHEYYYKCKVKRQEYMPQDNCPNCKSAKLLVDTIIVIQGSRRVETISLFASTMPIIKTTYKLNYKRTKNDTSRHGSYLLNFPTHI